MRALRGANLRDGGAALKDHQLCSGPSKLCIAFDITKNSFNKVDLAASDDLWVSKGKCVPDSDVVVSARIGLDRQPEEWRLKPWRFYVANCRSVSVKDKVERKLHQLTSNMS